MHADPKTRPDNDDPDNESGRVSRSGTSAGISVDNESTSGGEGPIPPGGDTSRPRPQPGPQPGKEQRRK